MNIKVDKSGYIQVERGGEYLLKECPHNGRHCGDWCALFGEPVIGERYPEIDGSLSKNEDLLTLCQGRVLRGEITDERGRK